MNSTRMRLWAGLFVLVVFVAGIAGGVAVRPWIVSESQAASAEPDLRGGGRGARRAPMTERLLDRIASDIGLTEEQDQQLREVFETGRQRLREVSEDVGRQFETEREQMNAEIATILTAEQMEKFDQEIVRMSRERRSRAGRGESRGPRGPESRRVPGDGPAPPDR